MRRKRGQGHILKRGTSYYLRFCIDGQIITKVLRDEVGAAIKNQRDAEKARDVIMSAYAAKDKKELRKSAVNALMTAETKAEIAADIANPPLRIKEAWQAYLDSQGKPDSGERTLKDYEGYFNKFASWIAKNHANKIFMRDVTEEIAANYATYLNKSGLSANSFNKNISFMNLLYNTLEKAIRLKKEKNNEAAEEKKSPFDRGFITRKELKKQSRREFTIDEIRRILDSAEGDLLLLLEIGIFTGLRLGDACTLKWGEIDLTRRIIKRTLNKTGGDPILIGIPRLLQESLEAIPAKARVGYLLPEIAEIYQNVNTRPRIVRKLQEHFKKCGIATWKAGTGGETGKRAVVEVGFHSLRHSYVSLLAASGAPVALIQKQVGHANPEMTNHYLHMDESGARQLAEALTLTAKCEQKQEPERERLAELARSADIEAVKRALKILETKD
ncbi:MAG: site-specific tyrosine recombinase XerD [Smithella sp. PtaU1.Bin162]|nr:MAG: site-specific tyrosine recombinase XerD [Smithella sp. PtaU1.Bin162]